MNLREVSELNRVVIIDNSKEDGGALHDALQEQMIGSVFLHVNGLSGLPTDPFPNVNLVFLDLDLISSVANSRDKASRAIACLSRVVKPNSFYLLVIWSSHTTTDLENDFREILQNNDELMPSIPPISLAKLDCKNSQGYSVPKITRNITKKLNSIKAQSILMKWQGIVSEETSHFINGFTKADNQRGLSKKIHALADAYAGNDYRDDLTKNALFTLNDALKGSLDGAVAQSDLTSYDNRIDQRVAALDDIQKSKINSNLMIDPNKKLGPGCVFKCTKCSFEHLTSAQYRSSVIKVVMNITPVCDAAQKKNALQHYAHGALVPVYAYKTIKKAGFVYVFHNQFHYQGESYYLAVNLKSVEGVVKRKHPGLSERKTMKNASGDNVEVVLEALDTDLLDNVIFKFRDPVTLDIQQKSSSYMSRFGHTYLA